MLSLLVSEVEAQVQALYPCLVAGGTTPQELYAGNEPALNAYNRMVGYLVAARFLPSRSGQQYQALSGTVKLGPVTKTFGGSIDVSTQIKDFLSRAVEAAGLIPCIAAALALVASVRGGLGFGLAGYRRAHSGICTLEGALSCLIQSASGWPYVSVGHSLHCPDTDPDSVVILTVQTAASGTGWVAFGSVACQTLDVVNNTGTDIEYRRGGAGASITIPEGSARAINAITNANQIEVRRLDQSATQVTLTAEAITY